MPTAWLRAMPWLVRILLASDFKGLGLIQGYSTRNFCGYIWLGQVLLRILLFPLVTFHKIFILNLIRPTLYRWKEIPAQALHNFIPSQKQVQNISQRMLWDI